MRYTPCREGTPDMYSTRFPREKSVPKRLDDSRNQTHRTTQQLYASAHSVRVGKSALAGTRMVEETCSDFGFSILC